MRAICCWALLTVSLFASNCPPDLLSFGIGAYDFYRDRYRTFEFEIEYKPYVKAFKSPNRYLEFRPLIGVMATARGTFYGYLGINFDLLFCDHIHFAPGFAAGYFTPGKGKNLGYPLEFRSGIELGWQFSDWHRLGIHFYHLSNASLGRRNPGEESLVLFYDIPLVKGFPFIREK
ncbi:MAG: acyloxyacyl hydrolase [Verrucomicrobia bacterium]|nr:acyloxyacyl hydrolase [Verrucomicrobiota bacterium]MDE3048038.1 acyloxyacyl hydrolase [Verrucomicrobiota bacterium]